MPRNSSLLITWHIPYHFGAWLLWTPYRKGVSFFVHFNCAKNQIDVVSLNLTVKHLILFIIMIIILIEIKYMYTFVLYHFLDLDKGTGHTGHVEPYISICTDKKMV